MIYLVTAQKDLFNDSEVYEHATLSDVINYLNSVEEVGLDLETTSFDPHTGKIISMQLGDYEVQYVIDCSTIDILPLKSLLESKILLGQNLKFDLRFLYKRGIFPRNIWDTFVVEKIIHCGYTNIRHGLDSITERYLGFALDKSVRKDISKEGLTSRVIKYAADDVKYLPAIKTKQEEVLKEKDLEKVVYLENRFTPALAYIEYCGFKLDVDKWKAKMQKDQVKLQEAQKKLDDQVMSWGLTKYIQKQLDLFEPATCSINWSSSKQVVELFEDLGINCTILEKGIPKKSVEASVIEKQKDKNPIVELYLNYKKAEKVVSTYGENFLRQINPATGRLHTQFKQIMDTGRISSGGKDKVLKMETINFQNIPNEPETRACFVAEKGNTLIVSDYSGQEQIVLANASLDNNILEFYDKGLADMHSFIASKMYPELEGLTLKEIKDKYSDKRQEAKIAGFAINYGGVGDTIARQLNKSKEDGERVYNAYFTAFPGLKKYFNKVKEQGLKDGYILISNLTKRKCFIEFFDKYKDLENQTKEEGFWERYRKEKALNSTEFISLKRIVSDYFYYKGIIERMSLNYPIQGGSAEITKISCVKIFEYILDNNLQDIVLFVNTIHDENVLECPLEMSESISEVVREAMLFAGSLYCKRVKLKADPELTLYWKK